MRVRIHRNLHKKCWSVVDTKTGRVIAHRQNVVLRNVKFVVQQGGRQRVLRERKKNVHAYVVGDLSVKRSEELGHLRKFVYDPYTAGSFLLVGPDARVLARVEEAKAAYFTSNGAFAYLS